MRDCGKQIVRIALTSCLIMAAGIYSFSQISPGPLSKAHTHLEGINNCTACHTLGEKVSNQKCLECHEFLKSRVDKKLGFHSSREVKGKDCFKCHSDHHGLKFEMIRFDEDLFDHDLSGYKLEGAHKEVDCNECHKDDNIIDYEIADKEYTYLGLTTECLLCHEDEHKNTLPANCSKCHTFDAFIPASLFDHDDSNFPLLGEHKKIDCAGCHQPDVAGIDEGYIYRGLKFSSCESCHSDVHDDRLGSNCIACHTERSFRSFSGGKNFKHNQTRFPLRGKHKRAACKECHEIGKSYTTVFNDYWQSDFNECITCHEDIHEGKFGTDCRQCHNENSFNVEAMSKDFNHGMTEFPLEGKHVNVDCKSCHGSSMTESLPHSLCLDCHDDFHEGQLKIEGQTRDCQDCHNVYGFDQVLYSFEDHAETQFPLEGAHLATPCFLCHLDEKDEWRFELAHENCTDCHEDIHEGKIDGEYLDSGNCLGCHAVDAWDLISFDHNRTQFELIGAHQEVRCAKCHIDESGQSFKESQLFTGISSECSTCHQDSHRGQFAEGNVTDCRRCHDENAWVPSHFDHDSAAFVLDGAHINVDCGKCHIPTIENGVKFVNFSMTSYECIDCHQ